MSEELQSSEQQIRQQGVGDRERGERREEESGRDDRYKMPNTLAALEGKVRPLRAAPRASDQASGHLQASQSHLGPRLTRDLSSHTELTVSLGCEMPLLKCFLLIPGRRTWLPPPRTPLSLSLTPLSYCLALLHVPSAAPLRPSCLEAGTKLQ